MNNYDYIILGAGLTGVISAVTLASKNKKVVLLNKYGFTGGLLTESFDCYQKYDKQSTSEIFNKFFYDLVNRRRSILFDDGKYLIINPESIKLSLQALIEEYEIETLFHINPFRIKKQKGDNYIIDLIAREGIISFSSHNLIDTTDNYTLHSLLNRKSEISEVKYNFFTSEINTEFEFNSEFLLNRIKLNDKREWISIKLNNSEKEIDAQEKVNEITKLFNKNKLRIQLLPVEISSFYNPPNSPELDENIFHMNFKFDNMPNQDEEFLKADAIQKIIEESI